MKIFFSKQQFQSLLRLAYLGEWLAHACDTGGEEPDDLSEIEQYLMSFAHDFGLDDIIEHDSDTETYYPTVEFEESLSRYIDDYNDDIFWEELAHRLAARDFLEFYGQDAVFRMSSEERMEKQTPFLEKYEDELADNGLDNLRLQKGLDISKI